MLLYISLQPSPSTMARTPALTTTQGTATRATSLYDQLRTDLLDGSLVPGGKLAIEALSYGKDSPEAAVLAWMALHYLQFGFTHLPYIKVRSVGGSQMISYAHFPRNNLCSDL